MKCKNISTAGATPLQRAVWTLCGSMALLALTPAVSAPADTAAGQGMANPGAGDMLPGESLQLVAGRQHLMALADAPVRIAVGDPNVLDVKLLRATPGSGASAGSGSGSGGTELLLTPKAQGSTSLVVWPRKGGVPQRWEVQVRGQHLLLEKRLASVPSMPRPWPNCAWARPPRRRWWTTRRSMSGATPCRWTCRWWSSRNPP